MFADADRHDSVWVAGEPEVIYTEDRTRWAANTKGDLMAFLGTTLGGIAVGFAAGMVGQSFLSSAGSAAESTLRPITKALVAGGLGVVDHLKALTTEAVEQVQDLVAEVQSERAPASPGKGKRAD